MRFPLRYQLLIPLVAVALVSLAALAILYGWLASKQTQSRIDTQMQGVARVLSESNFPLTQAVLEQMKLLAGADFVVTDFSGNIQLATLPGLPPTLSTDDRVKRFDIMTLSHPIDLAGERYHYASVELSARPNRPQPLVLHVLFPHEDFRAAWRSAFFPPLAVGLATVLAITLVVLAFASRITRTAGRLGRDIEQLAAGDFTPLPLPGTNDELRDLAQAINQTAVRLADYQQQIRHTEQMRTLGLMGAALAHELRNAATGCRLAVDLHSESCPLGREDESLDVARQQLRLIESRLLRFLSLGKPRTAAERQPVELRSLIEGLLPLVRPMAKHAHVELCWNPPAAPIPLMADADEIGQGILNVVVNAIQAAEGAAAAGQTSPEVTITAAAGAHDGEVDIVVADTGPGPPESLREVLFQPFATSRAEGVGLGLAVASEAFMAHGGGIDWRRDGGRTLFTLRLPRHLNGSIDGASPDRR